MICPLTNDKCTCRMLHTFDVVDTYIVCGDIYLYAYCMARSIYANKGEIRHLLHSI